MNMDHQLANTQPSMTSILASSGIKSLGQTLHLDQKQIMRATSTALRLDQNPRLVGVDRYSLVRFCFETARYDFASDDAIWPVPYKGGVQVQFGWRAYRETAMRSGRYKDVETSIVYSNDHVKKDRVKGTVYVDFDDNYDPKAPIIGYYAYALNLDGTLFSSAYITKEDAIAWGKKYSKSFGDGPWTSAFDAMARKTIIIQLCKQLPETPEIKEMIALDKAVIKDDVITYEDNPLADALDKPQLDYTKRVGATKSDDSEPESSNKEDSNIQDSPKNTSSEPVEAQKEPEWVNARPEVKFEPKDPKEVKPEDFLGKQVK